MGRGKRSRRRKEGETRGTKVGGETGVGEEGEGKEGGGKQEGKNFFFYFFPCMSQISYVPCKRHGDLYVA
jgi:hypothetical protein